MNDPLRLDEWKESALKEITQLKAKEVWDECWKSEAVDKKEKIIPCTWIFRIKRTPDGEFSKCKSRICLRGDLMEVDEETFAPVVSWSTVRFFLVLSMTLGWKTVSIDWANAFVQAVLEKPMYMATPRGFLNKYGNLGCLRLKKSLYGSTYAPLLWWLTLTRALKQLGLKQSPFD